MSSRRRRGFSKEGQVGLVDFPDRDSEVILLLKYLLLV